jgi:hypothetical protein
MIADTATRPRGTWLALLVIDRRLPLGPDCG